MILRSRKIPAQPLKDLHTPRKKSEGNSPKTPRSAARVPKRVQPKSPCTPSGTFSKKTTARLTNICLNSPNAEDLKTPMRERSVRVHFQFDDPFPGKQDLVSSIYTPVLTYLSTQDEDSDGCNVPTKNCLYFNHIPVDRTREDFNPYKFICNIQQTPCDQRQRGKDIPFKTRSAPESTLVLDLDEILVDSSLLPLTGADFTFLIPFQDTYYKVYVKLRPHAMEFLETLCKVYEIFVFTTAKKEYAEKILDLLDPQKKLIRHRLFQDQCLCVEGHYVKDLGILQRDLAKTVALDTAPHTIPYHLANRIPIQSWKGSKKDRGLLSLLSTLEKMTLVDDVRLVISHQFKIKDLVAED
ncbi:hypothetical protein XENTR_v10001276 [Xenopus tropicalis]|uniref:CTD small phosphatase-like protein 3 isoform X1 n=2 Tax=Xenopus tropicalis TaxID=8364 RepID=A0A6I8T0A6_XENTR|nr:CTD small phosphatase-like protein 3 isoform X1 [Xenopus tropicalis]KAE8631684.1 hypothetical protein XENTR_v10001276 [Xenopus tropicalis]|eukprot:XP_002941162.1 PREDICTED: CTD small phosphatase-like protein 3 isoform X1 [Xenopus tropicalis]